MRRTGTDHKAETVTFRIDPALKAAFSALAEKESRPVGALLRELVRERLEREQRQAFAREARRQSEAIAARCRDADSDESRPMRELEAEFDEDAFADEWKA